VLFDATRLSGRRRGYDTAVRARGVRIGRPAREGGMRFAEGARSAQRTKVGDMTGRVDAGRDTARTRDGVNA